jgi:hypothetical protein
MTVSAVAGVAGTACSFTPGVSASISFTYATNSASCSTLSICPARRDSHAVLAPAPYSNTRASGRPARNSSTRFMAG